MTESIEKGGETFPTEGDVMRKIEKYLDGREYGETRREEDELGAWFIELKSVDSVGDLMFVYYRRAGNFGPNMFSNETVIEVVYTYEGVEMGGGTVARWQDGTCKDA